MEEMEISFYDQKACVSKAAVLQIMTYLFHTLLQYLGIKADGRCAHMSSFFQSRVHHGLYLWMILRHWKQ